MSDKLEALNNEAELLSARHTRNFQTAAVFTAAGVLAIFPYKFATAAGDFTVVENPLLTASDLFAGFEAIMALGAFLSLVMGYRNHSKWARTEAKIDTELGLP